MVTEWKRGVRNSHDAWTVAFFSLRAFDKGLQKALHGRFVDGLFKVSDVLKGVAKGRRLEDTSLLVP